MTGSVAQLNISLGGIPKRPIPQAMVTPLGLEGDRCAHPEIHGGPRQALLLISAEGIDELIAGGFPLFYGALGENVTTRGLDRRQFRIGQRYRLGEALIELTKIRVPCSTLDVYGPGAIQRALYDRAVSDGDPASERWGLSGFYAAVVRTGMVRTGDPIALVDQTV
jgi:MOSC domain-containing protein YiiM